MKKTTSYIRLVGDEPGLEGAREARGKRIRKDLKYQVGSYKTNEKMKIIENDGKLFNII